MFHFEMLSMALLVESRYNIKLPDCPLTSVEGGNKDVTYGILVNGEVDTSRYIRVLINFTIIHHDTK